MKKIILSISILAFFASCSSTTDETKIEETNNIETAEVSGDFYCPMKCEGDKTFVKAGKCGVCGMDLISKESASEEQHEHEHNHGEEGHQH